MTHRSHSTFGGKGAEMEQDYTKYSIPELQESLAIVDGTKYPENKAALELELQARRDSGEYQRFLQEQQQSEKREKVDSISFAWKMKKGIGIYLIVAALYALTGVSFNTSGGGFAVFTVVLVTAFLIASLAGGVGLLLNKAWGHWTAVVVLGLQVVKIQAGGLVFNFLSLIGIYIYAATDWTVGITAAFEPGVTLAVGSTMPFLLGVNVFAIAMIFFLFAAQEHID
jgi:hypothetical protein